jgi:hypothetical protein
VTTKNSQVARGLFLKDCPYDKKGSYEKAVKEVAGLMKDIRDVNVFIVSDPATRPPNDILGPGTSRTFATTAKKARDKKQPVITTIVARNGGVSNLSVTVASDPIRLPVYAIQEHPKPAPTPVVKAPAPRIRKDPIIITNAKQPLYVPPPKPKLGEVISGSADISYLSSLQTNAPTAPDATLAPVTSNASSATKQDPLIRSTNSPGRVMIIKRRSLRSKRILPRQCNDHLPQMCRRARLLQKDKQTRLPEIVQLHPARIKRRKRLRPLLSRRPLR